jgi:hypothetical protein
MEKEKLGHETFSQTTKRGREKNVPCFCLPHISQKYKEAGIKMKLKRMKNFLFDYASLSIHSVSMLCNLLSNVRKEKSHLAKE